MGTCVSNHEEIVKELKKYDNNALILEHLKQNQENFLVLTKSFNQIATLNRSEPNLAMRSEPSISPCHQHLCNCHCNYSEKENFAKSLLLVSLKNRESKSKLQYSEAARKIRYDVIDNESDTLSDESCEENSSTTIENQYQDDSKAASVTEKYLGKLKKENLSATSHNSLKKAHCSKVKRYEPIKQRHFQCNHLSSSPSRHLIIVNNNNNNNSSTLSSSCESLKSNRRFYNEINYDNSHFDRSIISKNKNKANKNARNNSLHNREMLCMQNDGSFCETANCGNCHYALNVLDQSNPKNNSREHFKNSKKRSESSYINIKNYDRQIRKSVNFINSNSKNNFSEYESEIEPNNYSLKKSNISSYDPGNGLKEFIERQESKKSRNQQMTNNLSLYDNLNEFNTYLNQKLMNKHLQVKKDNFVDNVDYQALNQQYDLSNYGSISTEFSILPIKLESTSQNLKATESLNVSSKTIKNTFINLEKLDLSCSSHEKISSTVSTESLESSLNFQTLKTIENEKPEEESINTVEEKGLELAKLKNIDDAKNELSNETIKICEKLKINNVVESVGHLIFPSSGYINMAFKSLLIEYSLFELFKKTFKREFQTLFDSENLESQKYLPPSENLINISLVHLLEINAKAEVGKDTRRLLKEFQTNIGRKYFEILFEEYRDALCSIGGNLQSFFNNLNSLNESLLNHKEFSVRFFYLPQKYTGCLPSFRCEEEVLNKMNKKQAFMLKIFTIQENTTPFMNNFYLGLIESAAKFMLGLDVKVEKIKKMDLALSFMKFDLISTNSKEDLEFMQHIFGYKVTLKNESDPNQTSLFLTNKNVTSSDDLCISIDLFKSTFPFSLLLDRKLDIIQFGDSLMRHLGQSILGGHGSHLFTYFEIVQPKLNEYTFQSIFINKNMNYRMKMKSIDDKDNQLKDMEIKGSMIFVEETDSLLFIGSPVLLDLEELTGRGLYISDIPIHDAARDIILVGEQTKAQDGLKMRMEKLKSSIQQAYEDIEEEKRKNTELLNLIFPSDIAEKLWNGEKILARSIDNVTLLYSDIVGFTSICSTAQPIEIVEMLKRLYTDFDNACGMLDVYKLETIGDAYIVAGGLHKPSKYHAQRIAWMSLMMMESANKNFTHKGDRIKIRIGLHTGDVLAGIVGIKQPRYCLFGNTCNIANKFESSSEEKRIHLSDATKRLLNDTEGFDLESRGSDFVPENFVSESNTKPISWFLNSFKYETSNQSDDCTANIVAALNSLDDI